MFQTTLTSQKLSKSTENKEFDGDCDKATIYGDCEEIRGSRKVFKNLGYLIHNARSAFTQLRQAFIPALILQHFDRNIISVSNSTRPAILLVE